MEGNPFSEVVAAIVKEDPRYEAGAYQFVRQALDFTVKDIRKSASKGRTGNHVSGQELLDGVRRFALEQYGPLAHTLLASWGVTKCSDFGELVYNLIRHKVFSKTETDSKEDFADLYSFEEAFLQPFEPASRRQASRTPRSEAA